MCQYLIFNISPFALSEVLVKKFLRVAKGKHTFWLMVFDVWIYKLHFSSNFKTSFWHSLVLSYFRHCHKTGRSALYAYGRLIAQKQQLLCALEKYFQEWEKKTADFLITQEMRIAHKLRELNKRVEREYHSHSSNAAFWSRANEDKK